MPDPAELPPEIFDIVLNLAVCDKSDPQHLCNLSLLNHRWHTALLGHIYNEWTYNGARQPFMTLFKFVRTICKDAQIARLVQTLNVGNWGFYPRAVFGGPPRLIEIPPDEREWIQRAIHDTGLGDLEDSIFESLSQRDRRPLMAMLLASVPNLSTLYAHVPRSDPILGAVLARKLQDQTCGPLHELKELYLFSEYPVLVERNGGCGHGLCESSPDEKPGDRLPYFKLDYLWPVFYLSKVQNLLLYNLDPSKTTEYLGQHNAESHVENLYLVGYDPKGVFKIPDFQALISRTGKLKSLSLYNPEEYDLSELSNSEMWECLQKHKNSLKALDIYRAAPMFGMGHFGFFHDFTSLTDLRIHLDMLLGGCLGSPLAPFRLQETLPESIQNLTLHGDQGYLTIPDIPDQLQNLLDGSFPSLRSITLEKANPVIINNTAEIQKPYQRLKELCTDKGIAFQVKEGNQLPRGGKQEELWAKTIYMQREGWDRCIMAWDYPRKLGDSEELLLCSAELEEAKCSDEGDDWDSEDEYGPHNSGIVGFHTIPFTDHRGSTAYMVFMNLEAFPLPPLFSFAIYFTHPAVTPDNSDALGLFKEIKAYNEDGFDVRFDTYFLPSATNEDCIQHYHDEKARRGIYTDQVRMFKQCNRDEVHPLPGTASQIPGMAKKYHDADQVLFICSDKDWQEGQKVLTVLKFGSCSSNASTTSAFQVEEDRPITQESPAYHLNTTSGPPVEEEMFDMAHRDRDIFLGTWQKATSRGWTGW